MLREEVSSGLCYGLNTSLTHANLLLSGEQAPAVSLQPATYLIRNCHLDFVFSAFVIISIDAFYLWQAMLVSHLNRNVKFLFLV